MVLASGSDGVQVDWWTGDQQPEYQDSYKPTQLSKVQNASAIAANAERHVYAFQDGIVKEFTVDENGGSWSLIGNVDTVKP